MPLPSAALGDFCDAGAMVVAIVLTAMAGPSEGLLQAGRSWWYWESTHWQNQVWQVCCDRSVLSQLRAENSRFFLPCFLQKKQYTLHVKMMIYNIKIFIFGAGVYFHTSLVWPPGTNGHTITAYKGTQGNYREDSCRLTVFDHDSGHHLMVVCHSRHLKFMSTGSWLMGDPY